MCLRRHFEKVVKEALSCYDDLLSQRVLIEIYEINKKMNDFLLYRNLCPKNYNLIIINVLILLIRIQ